jgi:hypothetical protein
LCERKIEGKLPKKKKKKMRTLMMIDDDVPNLEDKRKRKSKGKKE